MNTLEAIQNRRSIRKYRKDRLPQEIIDQIIQAGLRAPSGNNKQSAIILQIEDPNLQDQFREENRKTGGWEEGFDPFYGAPEMLVVLADASNSNHVYDGTLAMENMMLAAWDLGIGSCWINRARQEFESSWGKNLLRQYGIEGNWEGIGHLALGYPDKDLPPVKEPVPGRVYKL